MPLGKPFDHLRLLFFRLWGEASPHPPFPTGRWEGRVQGGQERAGRRWEAGPAVCFMEFPLHPLWQQRDNSLPQQLILAIRFPGPQALDVV